VSPPVLQENVLHSGHVTDQIPAFQEQLPKGGLPSPVRFMLKCMVEIEVMGPRSGTGNRCHRPS
jgi:hypothetical protein